MCYAPLSTHSSFSSDSAYSHKCVCVCVCMCVCVVCVVPQWRLQVGPQYRTDGAVEEDWVGPVLVQAGGNH